MTIDEAIKQLQRDIKDFGGPGTSKICQAERLGIEALKWVKEFRRYAYPPLQTHLPGETEELERNRTGKLIKTRMVKRNSQ